MLFPEPDGPTSAIDSLAFMPDRWETDLRYFHEFQNLEWLAGPKMTFTNYNKFQELASPQKDLSLAKMLL